ncbi:MAG: UDP-N-acetylmuramoyl-L-alanine--D-glutamate ligase, partial [Deferrisomatales bacterium]
MELRGRRAVVLGAGVSGRAAARLLLARGARVDLWDDAPADRLHPDARAVAASGAELRAGGARLDPGAYDLAVVSPGLSALDPRVRELAAAGAEVLGELELGYRLLRAPVLAITGTNGKTTVTHLLGQILQAAGRRVFVGGNVGTPLVEAADREWDLAVVEVSSFQLETIRKFRPRVALLLNITDDHFDRHGDLAGYARAKARIFENQGPGDAAVVNADDPVAWDAARRSPGVLLPYSARRAFGVGAWAEGDDAVFLLPGRDGVRVRRGELRLPGPHNLANALAACLAAAWVGIDPVAAWAEARGFRGLAHRLQGFLEWRGVRFIDDSKATNVDAAVKALETVAGPVVLVAGGVDKGGDYGPLVEPLRRWGRQVVLVGAAAGRLAEALRGAAPLALAGDWPEAVRLAVAAAQPGDAVL